MTWVGPIRYYAHEETDEDPESEVEYGVDAGLSKELAYHLANTNPLYEVGFDFYVDPETKRYFITRVELDSDDVIERALPLTSDLWHKGVTPIHIDEQNAERFFADYGDYFDANEN